MKRKGIAQHLARTLFLFGAVAWMCGTASAAFEAIPIGAERMTVEPAGFRFQFTDTTGTILAPAHAQAGLRLDGQPVAATEAGDRPGHFSVTTAGGVKADVNVKASVGLVSITVAPKSAGVCQIDLSLGGLPVAYGLGDAGGWSGHLNLVTDKKVRYSLLNNGGSQRWQSSFVIFPENRLAGVVFEGKKLSVVLGPKAYTMTAHAAEPVTFHYLIGDMQPIYRNFRALLDANGYPNIKPKFRLFELGWESWAALGYQTSADTLLKSVKKFQDHGYPVRWAVTGSGFWEEGGTTTDFGQFGQKFSDPAALKKELHERDVKWMIGLRTNFVLPGGPHIPKTNKRDANLTGNFFNGNPLSTLGVEKDYFVKDPSGKLLVKTSRWFPIVPCYLLDGRKPDAVDWYADLYRSWDIDGIKEDTMKNIGSDLLDIFNAPIARLADEGSLVMARCGSFSASGTLLRINDTHVKDMTKRTPINYLQYAACGAPNVYSDTVGFKQMRSYSEKVVRHAWLMALTAGLAVGESPFAWKATQQELFKRPFDFHYQFGPYLFDAAMKSHQSGFPYTMTPLGIAYPDDKYAADPEHYQWLAGESLLCAPLVNNYQTGKMDLYLPAGTWFDYDTGRNYQGPQLLKHFAMPAGKTPCFVGGEGILVTRSADDAPLQAHIYPVDAPAERFTFYHPDGQSTSTLRLCKSGESGVWNAATGDAVPFSVCQKSGALSFKLQPDQAYEYVPGTVRENPTAVKRVSASDVLDDFTAVKATDGEISDASRWISQQHDRPKWLVVEFEASVELSGAEVYTGWGRRHAVRNFSLQTQIGGEWVDIPGATVRGNRTIECLVDFRAPVRTTAIRFYSQDKGLVRLKELKLR